MTKEEELHLRENIRYLIRHVKQKRLNEENVLRSIVRSLVEYETKALEEATTPDVDPTPN